ncbi:MAG: pyridoxal phosphate-dependent aminotransferase [bacterium]|nr:pyridoxal phosphate-dependent aminotransferase [bacterium]
MKEKKIIKPRLIDLKQSATLEIKREISELRTQGHEVFDFGLGQSPFPVPREMVEALREHAHEKDYLPVKGLYPLRQAIADFFKEEEGLKTHADRVIVGPGSKELLFLLQLVTDGNIIAPTPCWVSYKPQAWIIQKEFIMLPTQFEHQWHVLPAELERVCKSMDTNRRHLLFLNYPNNPSGLTYPLDTLKEIAKIARKHELIILSDEIYGELDYSGQHVSIAQFYPEGTIVSSGISKWAGAGGWRLGAFVFPKELNDMGTRMEDIIAAAASETFTSVSTPIQYGAIPGFIHNFKMQQYVRHSRRILKALGTECANILQGADLDVHPPQGAFYLFVQFKKFEEALERKGIRNDVALCKTVFRDAAVGFLPGSAFLHPHYELCARLSFVDFDGAAALTASQAIPLEKDLPGDFVKKYCGHALDGIRRVADWTRKLNS